MSIVIRPEQFEDIRRIHQLENAAFGRIAEAELVNLLRDANALILSHVAELDGEIIGQAAYSLVTVTAADAVHLCPALGPIAVAPAHQRRGVGSALVQAGLNAMKDEGHCLLFLVGHVSYYPRFGFQPALPLGFTSDYVQPDEPHEHFMVAVLDPRQRRAFRGHVRFHPAFDSV